MAHTCPECGCYCTCSGDMEDMDLGILPKGGCKHYKQPDCGRDTDDDFEDYTGEDDICEDDLRGLYI